MCSTAPEEDSDNIFEFRTTQCQPFKILFDILKESVSSGNIYFTNEGIKIRTADRSNTQYIDVFLEAEKFDHYYYKISDDPDIIEEAYININIINLNTVLKSITASDNILKWSYKNGDTVLKVVIISKDKNEERAYEIKTQDGDPAYPDPPYDMELYNYILLLPCADLSSILKDYKSLDQESIQIKYINNSLIFSTPKKGNVVAHFTRSASKTASDTSEEVNELVIKKEPKKISCYCDEFKFENLHNLSKCAKISGRGNNIAKILLLQEASIIFEFNIGKLGYVRFYLTANNSE
jgi:DNA polymerase III sliding clamp (beta) subunit (PCNA family)